MRRPILAACLLPILGLPAHAQAPAAPPRQTTTWEVVPQPLSALLDGGYRIVAMTGPAFVLEKSGRYVLCEVRPAGGMRGGAETTSECHRLN